MTLDDIKNRGSEPDVLDYVTAHAGIYLVIAVIIAVVAVGIAAVATAEVTSDSITRRRRKDIRADFFARAGLILFVVACLVGAATVLVSMCQTRNDSTERTEQIVAEHIEQTYGIPSGDFEIESATSLKRPGDEAAVVSGNRVLSLYVTPDERIILVDDQRQELPHEEAR